MGGINRPQVVTGTNKQQVKGMTNRATGEIKQQVGRLTGDSSTVVKGQVREAKGRIQQGLGDARSYTTRRNSTSARWRTSSVERALKKSES